MSRRHRSHLGAKLVFVAAVLVWSQASSFTYPRVPLRHKTPGELCAPSHPSFAEYRYRERIPYCRRSVSSALKARVYESYGIPEAERGNYTIDHLIPLSIGGSNSERNLWPEHRAVKATRPRLEQDLYEALRDGRMTQREAVDTVLEIKFDPEAEYLPDGY
jgi:hypothetical protein